MSPIRQLIFLLLTGLAALHAFAADVTPLQVNPPPVGYHGSVLLLANGEVDLGEPLAFSGDLFFSEIMGWSAQETAAYRQRALDFFTDRFGLENADVHPDLVFQDFQTNPATRYRAYAISGRQVPRAGWEVREGGFNIFITNPEGVTLGGLYDGVHVPAGTIFGFGIYNIEVTDRRGAPTGETIVIEFRSNQPIYVTPAGSFGFVCDVHHPDWGLGLAQGSASPFLLGEGESAVLKSNFRNVMTFSSLDGL